MNSHTQISHQLSVIRDLTQILVRERGEIACMHQKLDDIHNFLEQISQN